MRIAAVAVALATLAGGGVLAWSLTHGGGSGGSGGTGGSAAKGGSSGPAAQAGSDSAGATTVVIGVAAPLSGSLSALGLGIKNSADLAVKKANRTHEVPGVTFELQALDDQAQPATGQQNATRLVGDAKVLGVVGPLNSSVAQAMLGVLDPAGLTDVSPANTNPLLSQGPDWAKGVKARPHPSYFRTVATDAAQGPYAAQYLYQDARKTRLFVIDDNGTYGSGIAAAAGGQFTRLGGTVVGTEHVKPDDRDFTALAAKVAAAGADAVYYGGEYPAAAPLSQQLKQAGVNVPLMGGDGIYAAEFVSGNTKAEGDLATAVGAPADLLSGGRIFQADYAAAGYSEEAGAYGAYAYDAAWSVIEAVKAVVAANGGTLPAGARAKVTTAMAAVAFDGVTGRVDFDEYGDTVNRQLTVYSVKNGSWTPVRTGSYKP
ncbi:branched-chain amino acid ABC transporter substrate-binding protein [Kitasatospora sp. NPDC088346]|uniref:branched-chain amino acid ABC transporter substrate-binding protein n=1 Tax=Kitasatospora sp. NPDC088346 TaxID=3364073 RepID=UPI0038138B50